MAEATLRMPYTFTAFQRRRELSRAFARLYDLYGDGEFVVSVFANAVLQGEEERERGALYTVYYGQSYENEESRRHLEARMTIAASPSNGGAPQSIR